MQHHDNGSTWSGIMVVIAIIAALGLGYHLRDRGWVINIDQPTEVKAK
jgi:hypothetical protein